MKYRERLANGLRCLCNGIVISEISQVSTDDCFAAFYLVTSRSACASLKETMTLYQNRRVSARRFCYALMRQWTREWQNAGMGSAGRGGFRWRNGGIGAVVGLTKSNASNAAVLAITRGQRPYRLPCSRSKPTILPNRRAWSRSRPASRQSRSSDAAHQDRKAASPDNSSRP